MIIVVVYVGMPSIATNKQAYHDYEILSAYEAGIVLDGPEVKSVRKGSISLKGSYVTAHNEELWLLGAHIGAYAFASPKNRTDPNRSRKLLLKKNEIRHIMGKITTAGLTVVPLKVYTARNRIKIEIGIGRGKKTYEKRELLKKRSIDREIRQVLKKRV